jgi:hypothetical protein
MITIKKKMDNEASRRFWESFPRPGPHDKEIVLPSIGESWWEEEKKLSYSLLSLKGYWDVTVDGDGSEDDEDQDEN